MKALLTNFVVPINLSAPLLGSGSASRSQRGDGARTALVVSMLERKMSKFSIRSGKHISPGDPDDG
jgi:hypothetical protein